MARTLGAVRCTAAHWFRHQLRGMQLLDASECTRAAEQALGSSLSVFVVNFICEAGGRT